MIYSGLETKFPTHQHDQGGLPTGRASGPGRSIQARNIGFKEPRGLGHMPAWFVRSLGPSTTNKDWNIEREDARKPIQSRHQVDQAMWFGSCLEIQRSSQSRDQVPNIDRSQGPTRDEASWFQAKWVSWNRVDFGTVMPNTNGNQEIMVDQAT